MKIDGIIKETGEVVKPYETTEHLGFYKAYERQRKYIAENVHDGINEKLSGKNGDELVSIMATTLGYYEEGGKWLADERLHIADMKASLELDFANSFIKHKKEGHTNEVARMYAKIDCNESQREIDRCRHTWDRIETWAKFVGRCHDSTRSALGYEKSLAYLTKGR